MTARYRACWWISEDRQASLRLTGPDHADLPDADLLAEARAEAVRAGLTGGGTIEIADAVRS